MRLSVVLLILTCGCGSSDTGQLTPPGDNTTTLSRSAELQDHAIPESSIGSLSDWQQSLLSDAGWNLPATQLDAADSELPAPSWEMLQEVLQ